MSPAFAIRLAAILLVVGCSPLPPQTALEASTGFDDAAQANSEGVAQMRKQQYFTAQKYFQIALHDRPDAKYWFNLCASLYAQRKFGDAQLSCEAVSKHAPSTSLGKKARRLLTRIRNDAREQDISLEPSGLIADP